MNGGLEISTTPVTRRHTISVLKKPHGSRRNRKDMIMTNTGELKMMAVASPRGRCRNEKNRRTKVEPPTIPCDTERPWLIERKLVLRHDAFFMMQAYSITSSLKCGEIHSDIAALVTVIIESAA
jgi:hypothetical protein